MRFRIWPRVTAFEDTSRKRSALARSQRQQREKLPLLAEFIAESQPSADDEMIRRADQWRRMQQQDRDGRAQQWRKARRRLFGYDRPLRDTIRTVWRGSPYPADPVYLLDLLHRIDAGSFDLYRPPWVYHPPAVQPTTPDGSRLG